MPKRATSSPHAHEHGVNFIDTADVYSVGKSEKMVGDLIDGTRHDWVLATKLGNPMSERPNESRLFAQLGRARRARPACGAWAPTTSTSTTCTATSTAWISKSRCARIDALLRAGKIRYWGVSNFRGWRIAEAVHLARAINMPAPVVCQPYYNLLNRQPEVEVLPACHHHGLGVVPYSPIARGVLAGKYAPGADARRRHARRRAATSA